MVLSCILRLCAGVSGLLLAGMICVPAYAQEGDLSLDGTAPPVEAPVETLPPPVEAETGEQVTENTQEADAYSNSLALIEPKWTGSLMFADKKAENLMALYRAYIQTAQQTTTTDQQVEQGLDIEALLTSTANGSGEKPEEVLKLSLNSIVYENASDWSIWVNGKRYNRAAAVEGFAVGANTIKVLQANDRLVTYVWTPSPASLAAVREQLAEKQRLNGMVVNPNIADNQQVIFDDKAKTVTFTMRPNQTFDAQLMAVMEGKVRTPPPAIALVPGETEVAGDNEEVQAEEPIEDNPNEEETEGRPNKEEASPEAKGIEDPSSSAARNFTLPIVP